jgi:AAA15 family ATPase/GTPase
LELILVIIVAPVIMNGLAFWFQDNFLKKKLTPDGDEREEQEKEAEEGTSTASDKPDVQQLLL